MGGKWCVVDRGIGDSPIQRLDDVNADKGMGVRDGGSSNNREQGKRNSNILENVHA